MKRNKGEGKRTEKGQDSAGQMKKNKRRKDAILQLVNLGQKWKHHLKSEGEGKITVISRTKQDKTREQKNK